MLVNLEAGDKLLQTVYLSRWNTFVCWLNFLLAQGEYLCLFICGYVCLFVKQSTCWGRIYLFDCSCPCCSNFQRLSLFLQYFSKFSKEKEEGEDFSEEEDGGEKEKSAASIKKVSFSWIGYLLYAKKHLSIRSQFPNLE